MKKIKTTQMIDAAEDYLRATRLQTPAPRDKFYAVRYGIRWAIKQLNPEWMSFDAMTKEQKDHLNVVDSKRVMFLFDNGDVLPYDAELPFAEVRYYYILPELPAL